MKLSDLLFDTADSLPDIEVKETIIITHLEQDFQTGKKGSLLILTNLQDRNIEHIIDILKLAIKNPVLL